MVAIPYPQPRSAGGRPPCDPPIRTSFDSSPDDGGEPMHRILSDSVKVLLKHVLECSQDGYPMMLTLIRERKDMVTRELALERMFGADTLPPLIRNVYNLEYLFEEFEAVRIYDRLLQSLYAAEQLILGKMEDLNRDAPASDL